ncbi:MAG: ergothioneine biosynthesis protein EgtB [Acidobacteria bacterium]|nr:ergothioneine biosynthesis protein EgtB [Acidobacteriota bacterium]
MTDKFDTDEMARLMRESRQDTRRLLFDMVIAENDLRRQPAAGFRPLLWHWGHVGAFESYWILQRVKGDATISPHYDLIFDPIKIPKDDSLNLPPLAEIDDYLQRVRHQVEEYLFSVRFDENNPLLRNGYIFHMVLEHEYQHQETLMYLLQMLEPKRKNGGLRMAAGGLEFADNPATESAPKPLPASESVLSVSHHSAIHPLHSASAASAIKIPGGEFAMGADAACQFAYDNEQPLHKIELADFRLDKFPVTNGEYAEFVEANGYHTRTLWSEEGWAWKEEQGIEVPLYWTAAKNAVGVESSTSRFRVRELFAETDMQASHPVSGVSWYEAEAYARFVGKRLPTEAEWEKAAAWNPVTKTKQRFSWGNELPNEERANFANHHWGTTPVATFAKGQSAYGGFDMTGNVWEWTATVFDGYAGFQAFPYSEYSALWFDRDHRVLKGGSWATRTPLLRCSFRNFWRPRFRIAFAGLRCAADSP